MKGKMLQKTGGILNPNTGTGNSCGVHGKFSIRVTLAQGKLLGAGLGAGKPLL